MLMNRLTSGPNPVQLAAFVGAGLAFERLQDAQRTFSVDPMRTLSQVCLGTPLSGHFPSHKQKSHALRVDFALEFVATVCMPANTGHLGSW